MDNIQKKLSFEKPKLSFEIPKLPFEKPKFSFEIPEIKPQIIEEPKPINTFLENKLLPQPILTKKIIIDEKPKKIIKHKIDIIEIGEKKNIKRQKLMNYNIFNDRINKEKLEIAV